MTVIEKKLIKYNFSTGNDPKYIVVHDTGNPGKGADTDAHYRYFNGGNRSASAHYFVDDHSIIQTVEDANASWHCGDGKGQYGITNYNSIGIEICINSDGDYNKAVQNTIELVKFLMKKHNIPLDKVVRHYDASRKNCPGTMSSNNWEKWNWFKGQLKEEAAPVEGLYQEPKESKEATDTGNVPQWQKDAFKKLVERKIINSPEFWEGRLGETITIGEVMGILANTL